MHTIAVDKPQENGSKWAWNNNTIAPTFHPSINISHAADPEVKVEAMRCHYFIDHGFIQYCGDCTHALKGVTMRLPPLPDFMRDPCQP